MKIDSDGVLVTNAKNAVESTDLIGQLISIKESYGVLINILNVLEKSKYTVENFLIHILSLDFKHDPVEIRNYIEKHLGKNDVLKIISSSNQKIPPEDYSYLKSCIPTSVSVERSFLMLSAKDRNLKSRNVYAYFVNYYNSK
ncbi:hypothetical protein NGRA_1438 [Nosema granulosis]|uniref:Uncharacterized protein n=1 Tax=Nosema granulosis TaxID=83296 RepID=A0A9P6KZ64_9MICR|nr:hypothetical protein NGRA_1438 [Nosema granulosis]